MKKLLLLLLLSALLHNAIAQLPTETANNSISTGFNLSVHSNDELGTSFFITTPTFLEKSITFRLLGNFGTYPVYNYNSPTNNYFEAYYFGIRQDFMLSFPMEEFDYQKITPVKFYGIVGNQITFPTNKLSSENICLGLYAGLNISIFVFEVSSAFIEIGYTVPYINNTTFVADKTINKEHFQIGPSVSMGYSLYW